MKGLHAEQSELIIKKEYTIAKQILGDLEKALKFSFPEEEVLYVTMHLLSTAVTTRNRYENIEELLGKDICIYATYSFKVAEERNLIFIMMKNYYLDLVFI